MLLRANRSLRGDLTMSLTRRDILKGGATLLTGAGLVGKLQAAEAGPARKSRISARQGCFGGKFESAERAGLEGVELGVGGAAEKLSIADPANREQTKDQVKAAGLVVSSLSMDLLNGNPLATDPQAPAWVEQTLGACQDFGAGGILVPFFGKAHLLQGSQFKQAEVDSLVERLKALAPKAEAANVVLGLECTLTAKQYGELLDRVGSKSVGAYYDIGNCTGAGFDVPGDIRALGERLSLIHFKDGPNYLGEGKVEMEPVAEALRAIDYKGWIVLETSCPSKDGEADCTRNVGYVRKLMRL
jgi:sugar phosphate isomerase/epimerase